MPRSGTEMLPPVTIRADSDSILDRILSTLRKMLLVMHLKIRRTVGVPIEGCATAAVLTYAIAPKQNLRNDVRVADVSGR